MPIYAITIAKGGPKLDRAGIEEKDCPSSTVECHVVLGGRGRGLHARAADMSDLAHAVESFADRPVIDRTAIEGLYRLETKG